ncbi:MAG: hypothetical protein I4O48_13025 [Ralstonia sp.]|nr:hypothetical protein [Ralstonia sp.]
MVRHGRQKLQHLRQANGAKRLFIEAPPGFEIADDDTGVIDRPNLLGWKLARNGWAAAQYRP